MKGEGIVMIKPQLTADDVLKEHENKVEQILSIIDRKIRIAERFYDKRPAALTLSENIRRVLYHEYHRGLHLGYFQKDLKDHSERIFGIPIIWTFDTNKIGVVFYD
jgi:septum formation inhibitor MinC